MLMNCPAGLLFFQLLLSNRYETNIYTASAPRSTSGSMAITNTVMTKMSGRCFISSPKVERVDIKASYLVKA